MEKIAVVSCSHHAWIESSKTMGKNLAYAVGFDSKSEVCSPTNKEDFIAVLKKNNYVVIHTHGTSESLINQWEDNSQTVIVNKQEVANLPTFDNVLLVVLTACQTAGGKDDNNIACELSKKISKKGLVIANRFVVFGSDYDFGEKNRKLGWVAYQNGRLIIPEDRFPPTITMADAYYKFCDCYYRNKI